ncbi:hypothetical protein SBADM41S_08498 [Streptomyces badius]
MAAMAARAFISRVAVVGVLASAPSAALRKVEGETVVQQEQRRCDGGSF